MALDLYFDEGTNGSTILAGGAVTNVTGTSTFSSAVAAHGGLSMNVNNLTGTSCIRCNLQSETSHSGSFYLYRPAGIDVNTRIVSFGNIANTTTTASLRYDTTNVLTITDAATTAKVTGVVTIPVTTWVRIDWEYDNSNTSAPILTVRLYLTAEADAASYDEQITWTLTGTVNVLERLNFGLIGNASATSRSLYFDTIRVREGLNWMGPHNSPITLSAGKHFISLSPINNGTTTSATFLALKPSRLSNGDLLLISVSWRTSVTTMTVPSDWTPFTGWTSVLADGSSLATQVFTHVVSALTPNFWNVTMSTGDKISGAVVAYRDLVIPPHAKVQAVEGASLVTTHTAPALVTTNSTFNIAFFADRKVATAYTTWTPPAGMTERLDNTTDFGSSSPVSTLITDSDVAVASGSNTYAAVASVSSQYATMIAIAFDEVSSGVSKNGTETWGMVITESSSVKAILATTDTAAVTITEAKTIQAGLNTTDNAAITITESRSLAASLSTSDTSSLSIAESTSTAVGISRTDAGAVTITESSSVIAKLAATDTSAISISETNSTKASLSATDTSGLSISETNGMTVFISRTDTGALTISESVSIKALLNAIDSGAIQIAESNSTFARLSATDTAALSISESTTLIGPHTNELRVYWDGEWHEGTLNIYWDGDWHPVTIHFRKDGTWS